MWLHSKILRPVSTMALPAILLLTLGVVGCEKTTKVSTRPEVEGYVGSSACQACHVEVYSEFAKTGHNFKLNPASSARQSGFYPFGDLPGPPPGESWNNISYVIGGFWWKARFIDNEGYVLTGSNVQYNLATDRWVSYNEGQTQEYDCGRCHTTGYRSYGHQNNMPGIIGTWALNGIQCERCHGPGSKHVYAPYDHPMKIDRSSVMCGECHSRGSTSAIPAGGGFIRHHEQYNELVASKKISFACVDCHEPHVSLHKKNPTRASGIVLTCEACHYEEAEGFANSSLPHYDLGTIKCIDCHMPPAVKSAEGDPVTHRGDVKSHLFSINTDASAQMFTDDGKFAKGYITLGYACLWCHVSKTVQWAEAHASEVHPD
ncbi:MAG: hypothetical protein JSW03_02995 [Candidatus Eiseniibacteriota bacterium]|nr:MAG: hypothetical protein JSW03_02995 [Candidatus Eisenbacteria bacterium]